MLLDLFIVPYFFIQCCSKIPNSIIAQLFHQCQTLGCGDCHGLIIKHPHVTDGSVYGYSGIMSQGRGWSNSWSAWLWFRGAGGWRSIKFCLWWLFPDCRSLFLCLDTWALEPAVQGVLFWHLRGSDLSLTACLMAKDSTCARGIWALSCQYKWRKVSPLVVLFQLITEVQGFITLRFIYFYLLLTFLWFCWVCLL